MSEDKIMDKTTLNNLLQTAYETRANSYSPYSKFPVGCAILLKDNSIIKGVNIENAAYGVVLCAERSAMASVISLGQQANIKAIAVATDASPPGSPCGMCRQFLSEFLLPKKAKLLICLSFCPLLLVKLTWNNIII
jgi:cytidine deaminase